MIDRVDVAHALLIDRDELDKEEFLKEEKVIKDVKNSHPDVAALSHRLHIIMILSVVVNSPLLVALMAFVIMVAAIFIGLGTSWTRAISRLWCAAYEKPDRRHVLA